MNFEFGMGTTIDFSSYEEKGKIWQPVYEYEKRTFSLKAIDFETKKSEKKTFNYHAFINFNFNIIPDVFKIETGCRVEHAYFFIDDNYSLTTYPIVSPRLNIIYTPIKNLQYLRSFSISAGVGLFSKQPFETLAIKKEWNIKNFELSIPKTLTTVVGFEFKFPLDIVFKIEGYYKYFFDRTYLNMVNNDIVVNTNGIGHAGGFDILLERKISRYLDGMISYSFIYARLYNPTTNGQRETIRGEPNNVWHYPSYHRWHNLNVILNIRPTNWMTITPSVTFASGAPMKKFGNAQDFYATMKNGDNEQIIPMFSQTSEYDDVLRTDFSVPFNLKISFNFYFPVIKLRIEPYVAVEDLFVFKYIPKGGKTTDAYTGTQKDAPEGNFSIPIPMTSMGIKFSF